MDSFYNVLSPENSKLAHQNRFDFDHPSALDYNLLYETLVKLKEGKSVTLPVYNFCTHSREETTKTIYGANVIIFEGIHALYFKEIRDMMDMRVSAQCLLYAELYSTKPFIDLYLNDRFLSTLIPIFSWQEDVKSAAWASRDFRFINDSFIT